MPARRMIRRLAGAGTYDAPKTETADSIAMDHQEDRAEGTAHANRQAQPSTPVGDARRQHLEALLAVARKSSCSRNDAPADEIQAKGHSDMIKISEYPQLKRICWSIPYAIEIPAEDALATYQRNWAWVDQGSLTDGEARLIRRLVNEYGSGVLHV